jgi:hemerythrin-like domain-containing protein
LYLRASVNPFDQLRDEHRLLARVLDAFEVFLTREGHEAQQAADFATFAHFFRDVADRGHHEKEERVLDPYLIECGFDWESGPLARIREHHDSERKLIRILQQTANDGWPTRRADRQHAERAARDLIESQRAHIQLEDSLVFPIADRKLGELDHQALATAMTEFESSRSDRDSVRETLLGAERLCARYLD